MGKKIVWLAMICLMVLSLLASSCAPTTSANPTTPTATTKPTTPTSSSTLSTPTTSITPTTPAGPEMVNVSLKKLDGTVVEKRVEKPKYGGELTLMRSASILTWDEGFTPDYTAGPWIDFIDEQLLEGDWTRGPNGTDEVSWMLSAWFDVNYFKGGLAESWEIQAPDTITFHIRKGVHFVLNPASPASPLVNGRELTADDIVWNIRRLYIEIKGFLYSALSVARPVDVYAPDKWTVVVKSPPGLMWETFEWMADRASIIAPETVNKYGDATEYWRNIGTDAFMVTDYVAMSSATFERNPNYWQKDPIFPENQLPYIDVIKYLIIPDQSTRRSAVRTGAVDLDNTSVEWEDANSYQKTNPELKYVKYLGSVPLVAGRQDKPDLPFKDINVRRALMLALDNQQIVDTYYGGQAEVFSYPMTPLPEWGRAFTPLDQIGLAPDGFDTKKIYEYHLEEAKQLLASAGYPNGFKTEVVCTTASVDLLSIVKEYWTEIGVDLTLDVRESGVASSILVKKAHKEMYYYGYANTGLPQRFDPNRMGQSYDMSMVNDPGVSERYEHMASLQPRSDDWWDVVKEFNLYVVHSVNYTVLPQAYVWEFWQPWLKRFSGENSIGAWNPYVWTKYVWIDQGLKKAMGH